MKKEEENNGKNSSHYVVASRPPNSDRLQRRRSCQYVATVSRLKQLEKPGIQRTITDNNLMRRFALLRVQSGNDIIEKLIKPGTSIFLVVFCS